MKHKMSSILSSCGFGRRCATAFGLRLVSLHTLACFYSQIKPLLLLLLLLLLLPSSPIPSNSPSVLLLGTGPTGEPHGMTRQRQGGRRLDFPLLASPNASSHATRNALWPQLAIAWSKVDRGDADVFAEDSSATSR